MGAKPQTVGGGQMGGVSNQMSNVLGGLLQTGQFNPATPQSANPLFGALQQMRGMPIFRGVADGLEQQVMGQMGGQGGMAPNINMQNPNQQPVNMAPQVGGGVGGNPGGGMGTPGANPQLAQNQTQDFFSYANNMLNQNPSGMSYNNPNNPRPDELVSQLANMQFDPMQFQTPQGGPSDAYNNAIGGMFNLGNQGGNLFTSSMNMTQNGMSDLPQGPASLSFGGFGSSGLMGDRGNVANAITQAAQTQRGDALANANERFTAMGGLGGNSTSAAFERAITNARGDEALGTALANADLGYRNLDLNAYNSENNALLGNRNIDAYIYGNQLDALGRDKALGFNTALSALGQQGNILGQIAGNEFNQQQLGAQNQLQTNQLNLNSALGFGDMNSRNLTNAGQMATNLFGQQGSLDQNAQQMGQQAQMNAFNQLLAALMGGTQMGTPQASTVMQPNMFGELVKMGSGLLPGVAQVKTAFG